MNDESTGWPEDFPKVMHFVDLENKSSQPYKFIKAHPDYDAAKNHEDRAAALRLVHDFLRTPENQSQLRLLKNSFHDAIIVPVRAVEAGGKNRIPEQFAEYIGHKTGIEVDTGIVQTNRVHRTGTDEWHRFAFRPVFEGNVIKGRSYILVDDVFSLGGSFNELRRFIESQGSKAVQTIALTTGRSGPEIALNPATLKDLIDKYGASPLSLFMKEIDLYEGNYKHLTEPEARALRRAPSLDEARDRILAARRQGRTRMGEKGPRERETPQIKPGRSFRR